MADNDQNDEYKLPELDPLDGNSPENDIYSSSDVGSTQPYAEPPKKDVKRNALIVVALIVTVMILYKLFSGFFAGKKDTDTAQTSINSAPITATMPEPALTVIPPEPVHPVAQDTGVLKHQVDEINSTQQTLQSQISSMNDQVNNINNNVSNLSAEINKLNQIVSDLSNLVNKQSEEIGVLTLRTQPKPRAVRHIHPRHRVAANIYYINAVIPGRAWLIGTNGSTLTVRDGTQIPGYGVVKLIDSMQGRILTSSGRIIKFSQADS